MPKVAKETCQFCHKKFKRVQTHVRFCKAQPPLPKLSDEQLGTMAVSTAAHEKLKAEQDYYNRQNQRAKEIFLELVASVTRLNQALATIVGEWRP